MIAVRNGARKATERRGTVLSHPAESGAERCGTDPVLNQDRTAERRGTEKTPVRNPSSGYVPRRGTIHAGGGTREGIQPLTAQQMARVGAMLATVDRLSSHCPQLVPFGEALRSRLGGGQVPDRELYLLGMEAACAMKGTPYLSGDDLGAALTIGFEGPPDPSTERARLERTGGQTQP